MKFGSWTYDGLRLDMVPEGTDGKCAGDIKKFIRHGEWDLTSMLCARQELVYECCPEPYPDITYTLELRRRHMFYFVNMIAPCFLISGLFDFSFFSFLRLTQTHFDYIDIRVKVSIFDTERLSTGFRFRVYTQNMNLV